MNVEQYEVKITEPAQRQLQEIVRYIAEDLQPAMDLSRDKNAEEMK